MLTTGNSIYAEFLVVYRVHSFGHSVNSIFTECLQVKTRQNKYTRQKTYLPSAGNKTLGKAQQDTRQRIDTRQKTTTCDGHQPGFRPLELCRVSVSVFLSGTRQIGSFAECFILTLSKLKSFFPPLALKLFLLSTYNMWYSMLGFGIFLDPFAIFN